MTRQGDDPVVVVDKAIALVRKGSFNVLLAQQTQLRDLEAISNSNDWVGITALAITVETYDQVGEYAKARSLLIARSFIEHKKHRRAPGPKSPPKVLKLLTEELSRSEPRYLYVRAYLWLILQIAIAEFRQGTRDDTHLALLNDAIRITDVKSNPAQSSHITSLLYFWRARIRTVYHAGDTNAEENFARAEADLIRAVEIADTTLKDKLNDPRRDRLDELTIGNYVLATILGFGYGQLRRLQGRLVDSLRFLRVAVPLSRASDDYHRRGYIHLLIGTALRSQHHLDDADKDLTDAVRLFGGPDANTLLGASEAQRLGIETPSAPEPIPPHALHLGRAYLQLALSKYNRIPVDRLDAPEDERLTPEAETALLNKADDFITNATTATGKASCRDHRDPMLEYGISVTRSLITTARGNYDQAWQQAENALNSLREHSLPPDIEGWGWLAKGIASATKASENAKEDKKNAKKDNTEHAKVELSENTREAIAQAEEAFRHIITTTAYSPKDKAAAHLHLSRMYALTGEPFKAAVHYDRGARLADEAEHGWIKHLSTSAARATKNTITHEFNVDARHLLAEGKQTKNAWAYMTHAIEKELKRRILLERTALLDTPGGAQALADELNVDRSTIFNWLQDDELGEALERTRKRATKKRTTKKRATNNTRATRKTKK